MKSTNILRNDRFGQKLLEIHRTLCVCFFVSGFDILRARTVDYTVHFRLRRKTLLLDKTEETNCLGEKELLFSYILSVPLRAANHTGSTALCA